MQSRRPPALHRLGPRIPAHLAAGLVALVVLACGRGADVLPPPTGDRVLLIGIDAATWTVMRPLIAAGKLPTLGRLVAEGWSGTLRSIEPTVSPAIWTTIATGKTPEQHGIRGFIAASADHKEVPVTSNLRRAETLWTIASRGRRRVNAVGWYVTWPVEAVNGVMVSDRFVPEDPLGGRVAPRPDAPPRDPSSGDDTAGHPAVYPATLASNLRRFFVFADDFLDEHERWFHRTFKVYLVDATRVAIAEHLMRTAPADLTMVYIWGIDPMQHYFWKYYQPEQWIGPPVDADSIALNRSVIPDYYRDVDDLVARLVAQTGPRDTVLIVSDHGAGPVRTMDEQGGLSGTHRLEGIIIASGNHVSRGTARSTPSVVDVTPTVLYLLGLPVGRDMVGDVIWELVDPAFREPYPAKAIPTYETGRARGSEAPIESATDEDIRRQLRSLGYIQ